MRSVFQFAQAHEQGRYVDLDDAPDGIVVDAQISVNEPIAGGDHQSPRYIWVVIADELRDMAGRLPDQFKVAESGVVVQAALDKPILIQAIGVRDHLVGDPIMSSI
jgi:hypothetical protein